ncbi:MAG: hypothetical protein WHU10_04625 [Fimbriimonadales bacterium]
MKGYIALLAAVAVSAAAHATQAQFARGTFELVDGKISLTSIAYETYDLGSLAPAYTGFTWQLVLGSGEGSPSFEFNPGGVTAYAIGEPPVSGLDWAIHNISGSSYVSILRGTGPAQLQLGDNTLVSDGFLYWRSGAKQALSGWQMGGQMLSNNITLRLSLPQQSGNGTTTQYEGRFYFNSVPVPEPFTMTLGALGLAAALRRRMRR